MVTAMVGLGARARWIVFGGLGLLVVTAIAWRLWHGPRDTRGAGTPQIPRRADRYEGSSGMGADGFGGYPSRPDAP